MTIDHAELRRLAIAATPGPWTADGDLVAQPRGHYRIPICGGDQCNFLIPVDAEFIAAANPMTVLALLDEVDRLRALLGEAADKIDDLHADTVMLRGGLPSEYTRALSERCATAAKGE